MKWFCCGKTRKEKYCPECGNPAWDIDDVVASGSLTEILVRRTRSRANAEKWKERIDELNNDLKRLPEHYLEEAEEHQEHSQIWREQDNHSDKEKIRIYLNSELRRAESHVESHTKKANKFDRWANSLYRHIFNTKQRI